MEWTILIMIVALVVIVLISRPSASKSEFNYQKRGPLFTKAERSFLGVLDQALGAEFRIFGKVRVADVLTPEKTAQRSKWQAAFNKISAKHFDFILCDKRDLSVVAAIELDDKSHKGTRAATRDLFLQEICEGAGLKLVRFNAKRSYALQDIRGELQNALGAPPPLHISENT